MKTPRNITWICAHGNTAIAALLALFFCFAPGALIVYNLFDPGIAGERTPRMAFRLHRNLAPVLDAWARKRVASGKAAALTGENVPGTEWPLFSAVFYLWSTESLQAAWERDTTRAPGPPKEYARAAIESLTKLALDPNHAAWVRRLWGNDYLHHDNLFYRYARIAAMTSHHNLTGDPQYLPMLREETESLAAELDASPTGLMEDYPTECYPADVVAAWACIRRADQALGTNHSALVDRALRAFRGKTLDAHGLPPYAADAGRGLPLGPARGCSNSYVCSVAPELWPSEAKQWYAAYETHFWQRRWGAAGFREFARDAGQSDWYMDVDAGPSVAGHGVAASAFGLSAARLNGRFDHAYPLAAQMLAVSWPLPNGRLLMPLVLSNAAHAPCLGEAAILYQLTRTPQPGFPVRSGGTLPPLVFTMLAAYFSGGAVTVFAALRALRSTRMASVRRPNLQLALWLVLVTGSTALLLGGFTSAGLVALLSAQFLPRGRRVSPLENGAAYSGPAARENAWSLARALRIAKFVSMAAKRLPVATAGKAE